MEILFLLQSIKIKNEFTLYKVTIGGQKVEITKNTILRHKVAIILKKTLRGK